MRKTRFFILVIGLAVLVGGWWLYQHWTNAHPANVNAANANSGKNPANQAGAFAVPVVADLVQKKDVPIYFNGIGTVQAYNTVTVNSRVTGQITQIAFKEGQDVKHGDLLVLIDPRPFQATYDQSVAKKAQDEAQLGNARIVFQRDSELLAKKVLDQQTYDTQKFLVAQFEALVQADQANIEAAQVNLDYCKITSPIDGRIGLRLVDQGNIVQAGSASAVCTVTQLKPISVLFTLPQQQLTQVNEEYAKGPLKVLAVDTSNTKTLSEGTLAVVNNQIDTTTGTIQLKATFANGDLKLWPGEFVNARLLVSTRKDGLVVPAPVIQRGPQGTYAYVVDSNNIARMQPVKVGQIDAGLALIDDGLQEGQKVVVDGQYKLQPGSKVQITAPAGPNNPQNTSPRLSEVKPETHASLDRQGQAANDASNGHGEMASGGG